MGKPLVSICCLTYNHEHYIEQCLEGFLMQKVDFPVEILIHDDASTDKTKDIIEGYAQRNLEIIKPIYQEENQFSKGVGVSRVFQFPRAKGEYIAMCEGDDYWTDPCKLQKQVDFLEANPLYSACTHLTDVIFEKCKVQNVNRFKFRICKTVFKSSDLLERTPFHMSSLLFRKNLLNFDEIAKYRLTSDPKYALLSRDHPLMIILSTYGPIKRLPVVMSVYRRHSQGLSENVDKFDVYRKNIEMADALADYLKGFKLKSLYIKGYWHRYLLHTANESFTKRLKHFLYFFFSSFYIFPKNGKKILRSLVKLFNVSDNR